MLSALVIWLVSCASSARSMRASDAEGDEGLPTWLLPADACPADVVPDEEAHLDTFVGVCQDVAPCLERCEARDPTACYAAALRVQEVGLEPRLENALFLRACQLGISSGCTNRAAAILAQEPDRPGGETCAARTFEVACARLDPWGCTMFGAMLRTGRGVPKDLDRALQVLAGGCRLGPEDEACVVANELMEQIRADRP